MDVILLLVVIGAVSYGSYRLLRWARTEDRREKDKRVIEELERWLHE